METSQGQTDIPAQIKDNQAAPIVGQRTRSVIPRWFVKTRSNRGAVTIAAIIPAMSNAAPIRPEVSSEYPSGSYREDVSPSPV